MTRARRVGLAVVAADRYDWRAAIPVPADACGPPTLSPLPCPPLQKLTFGNRQMAAHVAATVVRGGPGLEVTLWIDGPDDARMILPVRVDRGLDGVWTVVAEGLTGRFQSGRPLDTSTVIGRWGGRLGWRGARLFADWLRIIAGHNRGYERGATARNLV